MPVYARPLCCCRFLAVPLSDVFYYPKMDLELIFPTCLSVSINLPALLQPGFPAELPADIIGHFTWDWGWLFSGDGVGYSQGWLWI